MPLTLDGTSGMTAPQGAVYNGLATANVQASTSGTTIDFTGVPLWAKRITVIFNGVSLSGSDDLLVQIGSGSFTTSGYTSVSNQTDGGGATTTGTSASGFTVKASNSGYTATGSVVLILITGTTWVSNHTVLNNSTRASYGGGSVALSGSLDRVRITTTGTNTFDAGTINVMYE